MATTTREKLRLQTGVPVTVTLDQVRGKEKASTMHTGVDYFFTGELRGGDPFMIYLPVEAQSAITRAGVQPGEELQITKEKGGTFIVRRVSDAVLAVEAPPTPGPRLLAPAPRQQTSTPFQRDVQRQPEQEVPEDAPMGVGAIMARCLKCSVDVLTEAEKYAVGRGWSIERVAFNGEDIRTTANTIFINMCKELGF